MTSLVLEALVARGTTIDLIIEFGTCLFSTVLFSRYAKKTVSYEMQDAAWYEKMKSQNLPNVKLVLSLGPYGAIEAFEGLTFCVGVPTVVFVDGHGESRDECIRKAMTVGAPYIIVHDTEQVCYKYQDVVVLPTYQWIDVADQYPWTALLTSDPSMVSLLQRACLNTTIRKNNLKE